MKVDSGRRDRLTVFGLMVLINEARCLAGKVIRAQQAIAEDMTQGHRMMRLGLVYVKLIKRLLRRSGLWAAAVRASKPGKSVGHTQRKGG